jgi:hypothetical protein
MAKKVEVKHINSAIIGFWRMGAKPVEILGALYEGIHSTNYIELVIKNYINRLKD